MTKDPVALQVCQDLPATVDRQDPLEYQENPVNQESGADKDHRVHEDPRETQALQGSMDKVAQSDLQVLMADQVTRVQLVHQDLQVIPAQLDRLDLQDHEETLDPAGTEELQEKVDPLDLQDCLGSEDLKAQTVRQATQVPEDLLDNQDLPARRVRTDSADLRVNLVIEALMERPEELVPLDEEDLTAEEERQVSQVETDL